VRPLLDQPNVTLLVNAEVERLETGAARGASTGVKVNRDGSHEIYAGAIVVLAAGAARPP
jgi:choline dehydrogenase-like flavoprotein